jgi:cell division protease FtsH
VLAILTDSYAQAKNRMIERRDALDRIAAALLERETLGESELKLLVEGRELPPLSQTTTEELAPSGAQPRGGKVKAPLRDRTIPDPEPIPG